jgi:hypothetical protein
MKTHTYLQAPNGNVVRLKNGFSWPAFFFGPVWPFIRRAWLLGFVLIVPVLGLNVLEAIILSSWNSVAGAVLVLAGNVFCMYMYGRYCNRWIVRSLKGKGYGDFGSHET